MKTLGIVLAAQIAIGGAVIALVLTDNVPFAGEGEDDGGAAATTVTTTTVAETIPTARTGRFDGARAFRFLEEQVRLGPRPAGSAASRKLAERLRRILPRGRFQAVPGGLRNVIGVIPGRERGALVVVGAHYDTKDIPGFVGANDGASGTAVLSELGRAIRPRTIGPTLVLIAFDGEESPAGTPDQDFARRGLRGSRVAAKRYRNADAMVLLDFVGDRDLRIPREGFSDPRLWRKLRAAAAKAGAGAAFPDATAPAVQDDHLPFLDAGVPAIDLIDFEFPCFHRTCDDLSAVSERSVDQVGEAVRGLLATL